MPENEVVPATNEELLELFQKILSTPSAGEGKFFNRAAENAVFRFAARAAMLFLAAIVVPISGWIGSEVWHSYREDTHETNKKLDSINEGLIRADGMFKLQQLQIDSNANTTTGRFNAQAARIDHIEIDVNDLKRTIYPFLGVAPKPTPN